MFAPGATAQHSQPYVKSHHGFTAFPGGEGDTRSEQESDSEEDGSEGAETASMDESGEGEDENEQEGMEGLAAMNDESRTPPFLWIKYI